MLKITVVRREYELTEESIDFGEVEYDFTDTYEEAMTIKEFIGFLKTGTMWCASRGRPLTAYDWFDTEYQTNPYSNDWIELSVHCADKSKGKRWTRYLTIANKLGLFM